MATSRPVRLVVNFRSAVPKCREFVGALGTGRERLPWRRANEDILGPTRPEVAMTRCGQASAARHSGRLDADDCHTIQVAPHRLRTPRHACPRVVRRVESSDVRLRGRLTVDGGSRCFCR